MIKIIKALPDNDWLTRTNHLQLRDLLADECFSFSYKGKNYLKIPGMFLSYTVEDVIELSSLKRERLSADCEVCIPYNSFNQVYLGAAKYQALMAEVYKNFDSEKDVA